LQKISKTWWDIKKVGEDGIQNGKFYYVLGVTPEPDDLADWFVID